MPIILRLIEDVDPSVFEGQLEYAQHVTAIRRSVERPVATSQRLDE